MSSIHDSACSCDQQLQQLGTIYKETLSAFVEFNRSSLNFRTADSSCRLSSFEGLKADEPSNFLAHSFTNFTELPPSVSRKLELVTNGNLQLIVSGDAALDKLAFVNDLVGFQLLPMRSLSEFLDSGHAITSYTVRILGIRLVYAEHFAVNVRYFHENVDCGDFLDANLQYTSNCDSKSSASCTVPLTNLLMTQDSALRDQLDCERSRFMPVVEIGLNSAFLSDGKVVILTPCFLKTRGVMQGEYDRYAFDNLRHILNYWTPETGQSIPLFVHVSSDYARMLADLQFLSEWRRSVFPIYVLPATLSHRQLDENNSNLTESLEAAGFEILDQSHSIFNRDSLSKVYASQSPDLLQPESDYGELASSLETTASDSSERPGVILVDVGRLDADELRDFFTEVIEDGLQRLVFEGAVLLYQTLRRMLRCFVLAAYDVARDLQITPKRLEFVRDTERALFNSLMKLSLTKHDTVIKHVTDSLASVRHILPLLIDAAYPPTSNLRSVSVDDLPRVFQQNSETVFSGEVARIRQLLMEFLGDEIGRRLDGNVIMQHEHLAGLLARSVRSLETDASPLTFTFTDLSFSSHWLSRSHSRVEDGELPLASTAGQLDMQSCSKPVRSLLFSVRQLLRIGPWNVPTSIDNVWRVEIARQLLATVSASRLARCVEAQMQQRFRSAHSAFGGALRSLEVKQSDRLQRVLSAHNTLHSRFTPVLARLLLEAASLRDVMLFGLPKTSKVIGRGQFGVVFSCDSWAQYDTCAVKSIVPYDDRHWNNIGLEFFYSSCVGRHERLVALHGFLIDYSYSDSSPAVLIIMERMSRDLHLALQLGLLWRTKLQIAVDVVEGLRYIHSQGLVHRDIKLQNILLDAGNRAKISDLGFCKPKVVMNGSIVGTPIHMAPEMINGAYDDAGVDVYAFGILFWFICADRVHLPDNYEHFDSREALLSSVRRGLRPERLPKIFDWCWDLMTACWLPEASHRILLGNVETLLRGKLNLELQRRAARRKTSQSSSFTTVPIESPAPFPQPIADYADMFM